MSIEDVNKMLEDYFGDLFSNFNDDEKWFTLSNLSTIIAITSIDHGLERYKEHMNIPDEFKPRMNMKNEYLYKRFLLTSRKKNYVGAVKLKEGGVFKNAGLDVKGLSFTKSNFNKELSDKVEELVDEIMMSDEISVKHILSELRGVDEKIRAELSSDEALKYFDVKKVSDDPENLPIHDYRVNAVKLWNKIGNGEEIELPAAFHLAHIDLTNTNKMKKKYPENFMDITEFLIDRMRRDNLHKLEELKEDIKEDYESIDLKEVIKVTEKEEKGLFFKGYTEIENGDVHLVISEDDNLQSDDNQYIFSKFENKFRRHYGYNKTKEIVEKMDKNIMMFNDGEHTIIKISPMFDKDVKRMEMDIYEIYENTYRLVLNEFMGRKGQAMIEYIKDNNMGRIKSKWENKLGRLSANKKKYRDLSKLALPLDAQNIPQFILDFVDKIPFLSLAPNLLSPVSSGLSLETYRDGNKRQHISNVISYY